MNLDYVKSWVSQPDVCRCCLSASGSCDMTIAYVSDTEKKEVYQDMLQECFGISLSSLHEWGPSRLVCTLCIAQLRLSWAFKKQVLQSERHFNLYYNGRTESHECPIKKIDIESETEKPQIFNDLPTHGNVNIKTESLIEVSSYGNEVPATFNSKAGSECVRQKRSILKPTRKKKTGDVGDYENDSDTRIATLAKVISCHEKEVQDEITKIHLPECGTLKLKKVTDVGRIPAQNNGPAKQVSERKRVMLTCGTVLKDTTACPFRHHKSWFQCFFCFQDFMEINLLREHNLSAHADIDAELKKIKRYPRSLQIDISNLQCRHCSLPLTDVNAMRRHFGEVHDKVIYNECIADYKVDSSPYTCHICEQEFHVFRTLTTHLNEHYANCICDVCGKSFLNSKRLKVHKRTHESGSYPCNECGKVLKTKTSKANHVESAHSKRVIKCQICFKPMKHYNDRIKHMSEVHNITHKFKCPICSREYNIKHYLATHIRQTHGHKNKKCAECGMAFITNHGLKKHMLKHTGEKPFTCDVCFKSYARSYTLREHMRAHDMDKRALRSE